MLDLLLIVSSIFTAKELVKEKTEPVAPASMRFDWDAYWEDIGNGIGAMEQVRKCERGGYYTTKPLPEKKEVIEGVLDMERYLHDLDVCGEEMTEIRRKNGVYKYIKKKNK